MKILALNFNFKGKFQKSIHEPLSESRFSRKKRNIRTKFFCFVFFSIQGEYEVLRG